MGARRTALVVWALAGAAAADPREWPVPVSGPMPPGAVSLYVDSRHGRVVSSPARAEDVVGHVVPRALFPVLEVAPAGHCRRQWLRIGPEAWICGDNGVLWDTPAPTDRGVPEPSPGTYLFTSGQRVGVYEHGWQARAQAPNPLQVWRSGFGFSVAAERDGLVRTREGLYLLSSQTFHAHPSSFSGAPWAELRRTAGEHPFGWVVIDNLRVRSAPGPALVSRHGRRRNAPMPPATGATLPRLSRVVVQEVQGRGWEALARVGEGQWVRAAGLRLVMPQPPPPEVNLARRERWVDVDLTTQTLVAYEGADPVYATLVSTGLEDSPTEPGIFRVWEKHTTRTMDDAPGSSPARHMRYGDVPWVQFFDGSRALHGAYWHDHFGVAVSHGCVNLAPADARWLFLWTAPEVPVGWSERTPRPGEGALVRVRGHYVA